MIKSIAAGMIGVGVAMVFVGLVLAILAGCASVSPLHGPLTTLCPDGGHDAFVTERAVNGFSYQWFADAGPTELTAHNPTAQRLALRVTCNPTLPYGSIDRGLHEWTTCVPPRSEKSRLVEFLDVDALHKVCAVAAEWTPSDGECAGYEVREQRDY
jgi:hypothetical protein